MGKFREKLEYSAYGFTVYFISSLTSVVVSPYYIDKQALVQVIIPRT
jgi:hypothetical protein